MIVYHGSFLKISKPDITLSRKIGDFGKGFYVSPIYEQVAAWSQKFRQRGRNAVISVYQLDEEKLRDFRVKNFESYSEEWLQFIIACRKKQDTSNYDAVAGRVTSDNLLNYLTVELYLDGLLNTKEAVSRLKEEKKNMQICFRTQQVIDACLKYETSRVINEI